MSVIAKKMVDKMFIAAAEAIAKYAEETGLSNDRIVTSINEVEVFIREALSVAEKAIELEYAGRKISKTELEKEIRELIERPKNIPNKDCYECRTHK
ncbi:MAG: hypothetical protein QXZ41_05285 [Ignisphaera sp.]